MSKLVPNVTDTARIMRGQDFHGKFAWNANCIYLNTPYLSIELMKHQDRGRFFVDKAMITKGGGPWLISEFRDRLEASKHLLLPYFAILQLGDVMAKDLFSYRTCNFALGLNHPTRHAPVALQIVQKAKFFAIADELLQGTIASIN